MCKTFAFIYISYDNKKNINFWFCKNKKILHIYIIVCYALNSSCYYYYFVLLNILGEVFQMPFFQIAI